MTIKERKAMYNRNIHSPESAPSDKSFAELVASAEERVKPMLVEQLMRELLIGGGDTNEILNIYCALFGVDAHRAVRLAILKPTGAKDLEDFFFIKNTAQQYIGEENLIFATVISDFVVLAVPDDGRTGLIQVLEKIRCAVKRCYNYTLMSVCSVKTHFDDLPETFERLRTCLGYSFYAESDRTLCESDIIINSGEITFRPDYSAVEQAVRNGDAEKTKLVVDCFFKRLKKTAPLPAVAKIYCLELYVSIARCCGDDKIDRYMKGVVDVQEAKTLSEIHTYILDKSLEIAKSNISESKKVYSSLVRDTINSINSNIENENLSLRWLAGTILFTNVDYLGKLFKKETGKNFSYYVMEKRMEMAKELLLEGRKDRIYEIAEMVGYGSNSQYFSQVFKKYTGVSPLEYKEYARSVREKKQKANNS